MSRTETSGQAVTGSGVPGLTSARLSDIELDNAAFLDSLQGDTGLDLDTSYLDDSSFLSSVAPVAELSGQHKRKGSDRDDEEDDETDGIVIKRESVQDGGPKLHKKPGRKPIDAKAEVVPPTKRKAQNRAAQRAFRERKEQHLKDLEDRVQELTETTAKDKQVNNLLQAQIARLETELRAYREKSSLSYRRNNVSALNKYRIPGAATSIEQDNVGNNYQQPMSSISQSPLGSIGSSQGIGQTFALPAKSSLSPQPLSGMSPTAVSSNLERAGPANTPSTMGTSPLDSLTQSPAAIDDLSSLFSPSIMNPVGYGSVDNDYGFQLSGSRSQSASTPADEGANSNGGISRVFRFNSGSGSTSSHADSSTSVPQLHGGSSCNTSPESYAEDSPPKLSDLPENEPAKGMQSFMTAAGDNGFDWLVAQNNGQFDPVLFGDYRESQDAIVGDGDFNSGLFNDPLLFDPTTPFNFDGLLSPAEPQKLANPTPSQKLMQQVNGQVESNKQPDPMEPLIGLGDPYFEKLMKCESLKAKLENKGFKDGKFDLDSLCDDLKSKAKCTGSGGPVWPKHELVKHFEQFKDPAAGPYPT